MVRPSERYDMKIRIKYAEVACCPYCISQVQSRGEYIFEGDDIGEGKCDLCGEVDDLVLCLWEV